MLAMVAMPSPARDGSEPRGAHPLRAAILLSLFALGPALGITHVVVRAYRAHEHHLSEEWAVRAEERLEAGRPAEAAQAFRTALHYRREDERLQLRLAQALAAADRRTEARSYLEALWRRDPSDGLVNLELARLALRAGDEVQAEEHYRRALEGYWAVDGGERRRDVRVELADYLLARDRADAARAELVALAATLPESPDLYVDVGERLFAAGAYRTARDLFERALRLEPGNLQARAGAARASFETGDFQAARVHLVRLRRDASPIDAHLQALLALTSDVMAIDPDRPRLSTAERARRVSEIVRLTMARAEACRAAARDEAPDARTEGLDLLMARLGEAAPDPSPRTLQRDPDAIADVADLAFDLARAAADVCGLPSDRDLAVLTLARAQPPPPEPDAGP
jgi:tetratricopeptide (TPR) repeat protein